MGSLAHCTKVKGIDPATVILLRSKVDALKAEGYTHTEASLQAVSDHIDEMKAQREDVVKQAEAHPPLKVKPTGGPEIQAARQLPVGNAATWDAPETSKLDNFIYTIQDKHIDTKRVMTAINQTAAAVHDAVDVYLQEELYHGRAAKSTEDFIAKELKPLIVDMAARGVKMDEFETFLHNRHAEERNVQIAKINPKLPDAGSGIATADARAYLAALPAVKRRAYDALAARVDVINAGTAALKVAGRLESQETIDNWNRAYTHYVPLHREDMDVGSGPGTGQGYSIKGKSKRATGSTLPVTDILGNIALERERTIVRAEKNRVASALVGLAALNPNKDFWEIDKQKTIKFVGPNGLVQERVDPTLKSQDNVVVARMLDANGQIVERAVVFNQHDERAARMALSLKNLDVDRMGDFLGTAAKITRYFASINTQFNPVFGVVNLTRDTQGAIMNLSTTALAGQQGAVLRRTLPALIGVFRDLRAERLGAAPPSAWAATFDEFQKEGGQTGYRDLFTTSHDRAEAIRKEIEHASASKVARAMPETIKWLGGMLSDYNTAMENAVRLSAYKAGKEAGMTNARAASLAKNLTVNFNRKGQASSQIGSLYAFFNASTQGSARLIETLRGPAGAKIVTGGVMLGVLQALALAAAGFDDDEPPEFVRERSLIIPVGDKKYVTIPMPLGFHVIPNMGRIPTEFVLHGFRKPGARAMQMAGLFIDTFNPVGGGAVSLQTLAPTLADPLVALAENRDWTGKEISREDRNALSPTPGHSRAKDVSSAAGRAVSHALNALSGGTEYQPGALSPTPDQIDYLIGQVTGGVGREAMKAAQSVQAVRTGEDLPAHKIPLVGRFYGNASEGSAQAGTFYENLKEINGHEAEIKGRQKAGEEYADYIDDNPTSVLVKHANDVEKKVSALRKEKRSLLAEGAPAADIKDIEMLLKEVMTDFNATVKDAREGK